jgi:hypothetical protein
VRSLDTEREAERILDIYGKMSPERRLEISISLAQTCRSLLREGVSHRHREYTEEDVRLAVIRIQLGDKLYKDPYPDFRSILP